MSQLLNTKQHPLKISRLLCYLPLLVAFLLAPVLARAEPPDWALTHTLEGKLEKLDASGKEYFAVLTEQGTRNAKGHILLLHGARQNPDWNDVIRPLRLALPRYGWSTLSIELPQAPQQASEKNHAELLDQATARILAAQGYLQNTGAKRIVLIAYGLGARMAVDWLSKTPQSSVQALVLISMADGDKDSGIDSNQDLLDIKVPVLDIYAEHDAAKVLTAATERRQSQARMAQYRQLEIFAADQYYSKQDDELVKRIRGWLKHIFDNNNTDTRT